MHTQSLASKSFAGSNLLKSAIGAAVVAAHFVLASSANAQFAATGTVGSQITTRSIGNSGEFRTDTSSLVIRNKRGGLVGRARISRSGDLVIRWKGPIAKGMANFIAQSFRRYGDSARHVYLSLDSSGGSVAEGESVIQTLRSIRRTHSLATIVNRGKRCLSMCVPIFLQGERRIGTRASLWLFHEVTRRARDGKRHLNRETTIRLMQRYFVGAGLSIKWLKSLSEIMRQRDIWQTGDDLAKSKAGFFTFVLGNARKRI